MAEAVQRKMSPVRRLSAGKGEQAEMADERTIFYLDANELFDDEGGGLGEIYTSDDTHILARYYPDWAAWILRHARTVPGKETNQESETGMEPEAGDAATETGSE